MRRDSIRLFFPILELCSGEPLSGFVRTVGLQYESHLSHHAGHRIRWLTEHTAQRKARIFDNMADPITQEAPLKTYTGSCHCGAVEFEVTHPDLEIVGVSNCNCTPAILYQGDLRNRLICKGSICRRNGYLMIYPPPKDINFIRGNDFMTVTIYTSCLA